MNLLDWRIRIASGQNPAVDALMASMDTPPTIPADSVSRLEVYDEGFGTTGVAVAAVAVAAVAVATAVVFVVVHANSESVFSPDEPAKTRVEGCQAGDPGQVPCDVRRGGGR